MGYQLIRIDGEPQVKIGENDTMLIGVPLGAPYEWDSPIKDTLPVPARYVPGLEGMWLLRQEVTPTEVPPGADSCAFGRDCRVRGRLRWVP